MSILRAAPLIVLLGLPPCAQARSMTSHEVGVLSQIVYVMNQYREANDGVLPGSWIAFEESFGGPVDEVYSEVQPGLRYAFIIGRVEMPSLGSEGGGRPRWPNPFFSPVLG